MVSDIIKNLQNRAAGGGTVFKLLVGVSMGRFVGLSVRWSVHRKKFPFFSLFCLLLLWADIDFLLNDDEEEKEEEKEEEEYEEEEEEKEEEEDEEEEEDTE